MIRKGLSYPIPITEERKHALEQAVQEQEKSLAEQDAIEEIGTNPSDEGDQMPSGQD
jgi:hypothetical protein